MKASELYKALRLQAGILGNSIAEMKASPLHRLQRIASPTTKFYLVLSRRPFSSDGRGICLTDYTTLKKNDVFGQICSTSFKNQTYL